MKNEKTSKRMRDKNDKVIKELEEEIEFRKKEIEFRKKEIEIYEAIKARLLEVLEAAED